MPPGGDTEAWQRRNLGITVAVHFVAGLTSEEQARYLLAADARLRGAA